MNQNSSTSYPLIFHEKGVKIPYSLSKLSHFQTQKDNENNIDNNKSYRISLGAVGGITVPPANNTNVAINTATLLNNIVAPPKPPESARLVINTVGGSTSSGSTGATGTASTGATGTASTGTASTTSSAGSSSAAPTYAKDTLEDPTTRTRMCATLCNNLNGVGGVGTGHTCLEDCYTLPKEFMTTAFSSKPTTDDLANIGNPLTCPIYAFLTSSVEDPDYVKNYKSTYERCETTVAALKKKTGNAKLLYRESNIIDQLPACPSPNNNDNNGNKECYVNFSAAKWEPPAAGGSSSKSFLLAAEPMSSSDLEKCKIDTVPLPQPQIVSVSPSTMSFSLTFRQAMQPSANYFPQDPSRPDNYIRGYLIEYYPLTRARNPNRKDVFFKEHSMNLMPTDDVVLAFTDIAGDYYDQQGNPRKNSLGEVVGFEVYVHTMSFRNTLSQPVTKIERFAPATLPLDLEAPCTPIFEQSAQGTKKTGEEPCYNPNLQVSFQAHDGTINLVWEGPTRDALNKNTDMVDVYMWNVTQIPERPGMTTTPTTTPTTTTTTPSTTTTTTAASTGNEKQKDATAATTPFWLFNRNQIKSALSKEKEGTFKGKYWVSMPNPAASDKPLDYLFKPGNSYTVHLWAAKRDPATAQKSSSDTPNLLASPFSLNGSPVGVAGYLLSRRSAKARFDLPASTYNPAQAPLAPVLEAASNKAMRFRVTPSLLNGWKVQKILVEYVETASSTPAPFAESNKANIVAVEVLNPQTKENGDYIFSLPVKDYDPSLSFSSSSSSSSSPSSSSPSSSLPTTGSGLDPSKIYAVRASFMVSNGSSAQTPASDHSVVSVPSINSPPAPSSFTVTENAGKGLLRATLVQKNIDFVTGYKVVYYEVVYDDSYEDKNATFVYAGTVNWAKPAGLVVQAPPQPEQQQAAATTASTTTTSGTTLPKEQQVPLSQGSLPTVPVAPLSPGAVVPIDIALVEGEKAEGRSYVFYIFAKNGPAESAPLALDTPLVMSTGPSAPAFPVSRKYLSVTEATPRTLTLQWKYPSDGNKPIAFFEVKATLKMADPDLKTKATPVLVFRYDDFEAKKRGDWLVYTLSEDSRGKKLFPSCLYEISVRSAVKRLKDSKDANDVLWSAWSSPALQAKTTTTLDFIVDCEQCIRDNCADDPETCYMKCERVCLTESSKAPVAAAADPSDACSVYTSNKPFGVCAEAIKRTLPKGAVVIDIKNIQDGKEVVYRNTKKYKADRDQCNIKAGQYMVDENGPEYTPPEAIEVTSKMDWVSKNWWIVAVSLIGIIVVVFIGTVGGQMVLKARKERQFKFGGSGKKTLFN